MDTRTSEHIGILAAAMAEAHGELGNPKKSKNAKIATKAGSTFTYEYADLAQGLHVIRKAFSKVGITFFQIPMVERDWIILRTRIVHSDQWIEGEMPVARIGTNPQEIGSAMTYAKKQALFAMAGICGADDDDDGDAAGSAVITHDQAEELLTAISQAGVSLPKVLSFFGIGDMRELPASKGESAHKMIAEVKAARAARAAGDA